MKNYSLEQIISTTLRAGITVAAGLGIVGGLWFMCSLGSQPVSFAIFHGADPVFRSPLSAIRTIAQAGSGSGGMKSLAIAQLGILLLLATPVMRVLFSALGFMREGDRTYIVITLLVLATLLTSAFAL